MGLSGSGVGGVEELEGVEGRSTGGSENRLTFGPGSAPTSAACAVL
ncbi:hypothetical protein ACIQMJ_08515 [Actinosynnema sp. NPDC091369]